MILNINGAFEKLEESTGIKLSGKERAALIFPEGNKKTNEVIYSHMVTGKTKRIGLDILQRICEITGVDANYLCNMNN